MTCNIKGNGRASLRKDQRGLSTVEYALLFVLVVAASASLWSDLGKNLKEKLSGSVTDYNGALNSN